MPRPLQIPTVLAVAAATLVLVGCSRDRAASESLPDYVGGESCVTCHERQYQQWRASHHDLAMQPASDETVLGDFHDATFQYGETVTTFSRHGDQFLVRTDGPDGELTDYMIKYTFGVTPLQQYLIEFPDGRLQALAIAWDSRTLEDGGQRWFHLYPDDVVTHDDPLHWTGPYQNWNHMCAECHSTNLRKNYRLSEDRFETSWTDINVSCESCHGPGSTHVKLANELKEGEEPGEDFYTSLTVQLLASDVGVWLIDPETGTASRDSGGDSQQIEVCAPCHSRRSTLSQDVVPGRPLLDTHRPAVLDEGLYYADGQILDEVYVYGSFIQSKMYAAGVTCSNCHSSHGLQVFATGNVLCAPCHLDSKYDTPRHHFHNDGGEGAQCVACHMPPTTYMVVDSRRDHSMRVPRPDLSRNIGTPNACNSCHSDRTPAWAARFTEQWYGSGLTGTPHFAEALSGGRERRPESLMPLIRIAADSSLAGIVRATAVSLLADYPVQAAVPALEGAARDPDPLVRLASARAGASRSVDARSRLTLPLLSDPIKAVRMQAVQILATASPVSIPPRYAETFDRALVEYRETLRLHADRPESHVGLALVNAATGRYADAEEALRTAIRLNPYYTPSYVNLADLLREQGRDVDGELALRAGLRLDSASSVLRHALGLLLVRVGRLSEAMTELRMAAEVAPSTPRFVYAYAIGLHSTGETADAVDLLAEAAVTHPYDMDILTALVTLNLELGRRDEALDYASKLALIEPDNAQLMRLVHSLKNQ